VGGEGRGEKKAGPTKETTKHSQLIIGTRTKRSVRGNGRQPGISVFCLKPTGVEEEKRTFDSGVKSTNTDMRRKKKCKGQNKEKAEGGSRSKPRRNLRLRYERGKTSEGKRKTVNFAIKEGLKKGKLKGTHSAALPQPISRNRQRVKKETWGRLTHTHPPQVKRDNGGLLRVLDLEDGKGEIKGGTEKRKKRKRTLDPILAEK